MEELFVHTSRKLSNIKKFWTWNSKTICFFGSLGIYNRKINRKNLQPNLCAFMHVNVPNIVGSTIENCRKENSYD